MGIDDESIINVYNISGAIIKSININNDQNINLTDQQEGMYFIEIIKDNIVIANQKIVIVK